MSRIAAFVLSCASLLPLSSMAADCTVTLDSTDRMSFSTTELMVSRSCPSVTVVLSHSGKLGKNVMGHNWVISKAADMGGIVQAGISAGLDHNYLPPDDPRVIAYTRIIGGGEQAQVTFNTSLLQSGEDYVFFCSFPGHAGMMKGSIKLTD